MIVAEAIRKYVLQDETIEWIADSTIAYNKRKEANGHISILQDQLNDTNRSIKNIMAAIEQGIITETTKGRLLELEADRSSIEAKIAIAKSDIVEISRDDLIAGLEMYRDGDICNKKYQARLFDTFLVAVYVYDDELKIVFSFSGKKNTVRIPMDASAVDNIENSAQAECSFKLPPPPAIIRQTPTSSRAVLWFLLRSRLLLGVFLWFAFISLTSPQIPSSYSSC